MRDTVTRPDSYALWADRLGHEPLAAQLVDTAAERGCSVRVLLRQAVGDYLRRLHAPPPPPPAWHTCLHEAAHAVLCWNLRIPFSAVDVEAEDHRNGHVKTTGALMHWPLHQPATARIDRRQRRHVMMLLAGAISYAIDQAHQLQRDAEPLSWCHVVIYGGSVDLAIALAALPPWHAPRQHRTLHVLQDKTRRALLTLWPAVEALATTLQDRRWLTAPEAVTIIRASLADRRLAA